MNQKITATVCVLLAGAFLHYFYLQAAPVIAHFDSANYLRTALEIYRTGQLSAVPTFRTPGYPLFLALLLPLFYNSAFAIAVVQHVLIVLLSGLVTFLCASQMRILFAVVAGLLISLDPILSLYGSWIVSEVPFSFFLTLGVLSAFWIPQSKKGAIASGFCFGCATLFRPNGAIAVLVTLGLLCLIAAGKRAPRKRVIVHSMLFICAYLVVLAPWSLHRLKNAGTVHLVSTNSPFLTVQMLHNEKLFDPTLIADHKFLELYRALHAGDARNEEEVVDLNRSLAWSFHNALLKRIGAERVEEFYADYLKRFKEKHAHAYYAFMVKTFLELLHLRNDYPSTPLTGNRYLGEVVPYREQIKEITTNDTEFEILYHPIANKTISPLWQRALHYIHFVKPLFSAVILGMFFALAILISRTPAINVLFLLPYLIIVFQALAYSYFLHYEDRYTYVCNPLLWIQLGLIAETVMKAPFPRRGTAKGARLQQISK